MMDRISNLPDDVVLRIVSFLSAKDAARARSVSKNLKNLINIIPDLVFHPPLEYTEKRFKLFADPLLARHASHRIRRVSLALRPEDIFHHRNLVTEFLCSVLNRGVLDFGVRMLYSDDEETGYSLPFEVFTCKTVVKMRLGSGTIINVLPENACLPTLKTLLLDEARFESTIGGCAFARLLSACHVLEELVMDDFFFEKWNSSRIVSSVTLNKLTVECRALYRGDLYDLETISFDTPNLTYLSYSDIIPYGYPVVNLNSLVEAHLNLVQEEYIDIDPTNLIKGLKNVQFLTLGFLDTVQLFEDFSEAVPVFENLTHLSVATDREVCWDGLKVLVKKSPNLKTLTIERLHCEDEDKEDVCECLLGYSILASIEVLKIIFTGAIGDMAQVKHILEKLPCLELLEVHVSTFGLGDEKKQQVKGELLKLPRASSKCKVDVRF